LIIDFYQYRPPVLLTLSYLTPNFIFGKTFSLEMALFFLPAQRILSRLFVLVFIAGIIPIAHAQSASDDLYERISKHELIRMGDSTFVYRDDYTGAEKYYLDALQGLDEEDLKIKAYCFIKLSNVHTSLMNYDRAQPYLIKAEIILEKMNMPNSLISAEFDLYYGKYLNRRYEENDSAFLFLSRSIDKKSSIFNDRILSRAENLSLAESYYFFAQVLDDLNQLARAEEYYRKTISIYEKVLEAEHILVGRAYSSLSTTLRDQFDYKNAVDYAEKSIQIFKQDTLSNLNRLATGVLFLANIHSFMENYEASVPVYRELMKLIGKYDHLNHLLWFVYAGYGNALSHTGNFEEAELYIHEAEKILNAYYPDDLYSKAFNLLLYGDLYIKSRNLDKAAKYLFQASDLFGNNFKNDEYHAMCMESVGIYYHQLNMPDSALYYFQQALIIYLDDFEDENIFSNPVAQDDPDKREIFDFLYKKAAAWRQFYDREGNQEYLVEALKVYNLIDNLNDQARNSKLKDASLLMLSDYYHEGYELAIDCAFELYSQTEERQYLDNAFRLMEKSKSMLLFRSVTLAERSRSINLPFPIKQREDSLRMLNLEYEQKVRQERGKETPDEALINRYESEKFRVVREIESLRAQISEEYPFYYEVRYDSISAGLDDFENFCTVNKKLGVEYFWGENNLYRIFTDGRNSGFDRFQMDDKLKSSLNGLLDQLSSGINSKMVDADYILYNKNAFQLFSILLDDLQSGRFQHAGQLLIIPDGILAQLPFEALITKMGDTTYLDYSTLPYLIRESSINYAYSANLLFNSGKEIHDDKYNLLAFSYSGIQTLAENNVRKNDEMELPHSAVELNAIKAVFPGDNRFYYDEEATESIFKQQAPQYSILHLAVHGFADTLDGDDSRLVFKQGNDTINDSNLYMHELYGMRLDNTRLAVLSACETGIGKEFRGEGVFSMARGFIYAGCPTVIMSLWPIGDEFSANIMAEFYRLLKKGDSASGSLREAKLGFIKKQQELNAHPTNWAAFVYMGEDFRYINNNNYVFYIAGFILFLVMFMVIKKYRHTLRRNIL
jgi:CHAT domain-containing protein/tetratricopeptide (TPR) repeat protein